MESPNSELSYKKILYFLLPLASTWLMMSLEGPYLAALIARMPEAKFNLAAYGVAFSFAMIIEAPIIMIMSASNALVQNAQSYFILRKFIYLLNLLVTVVILIFIIPSIFYFTAIDIIGLSGKVAELTHIGLILLIPWPAAIGYRRFYQGILIRNKLTKFVAVGTFIRLASMSAMGISLFLFTKFPGIVIGASALSTGVICEAVASRILAAKTLVEVKNVIDNKYKLNYPSIISFYYPLALTSMLSLGVHPIVTFFMGRSLYSIESLAVLPVINSFLFIFKAPGFAYQEVGIALLKKNYTLIKNFAFLLGITTSIALAAVVFTPVADFWLISVSGLSYELSFIAELPLMILVLMPFMEVAINFQRAVLVDSRNTKPITIATFAEIIGILMVLFFVIEFFSFPGATAATIAFVFGRAAAILYLNYSLSKQ